MINSDLKKCRNKAFFVVLCKHTVKIEPEQKHSFLIKHFLKTFFHFSRLYLYHPDFFHVWKIAEQISRFSQEFKTLYEPCKINAFQCWAWSLLAMERKFYASFQDDPNFPFFTQINVTKSLWCTFPTRMTDVSATVWHLLLYNIS